MTAGFRIHDLLRKKGIAFEMIAHPKRDTALETAAAEHTPPAAFAKTVMVKIKTMDTMFVIPADRRLDLLKLRFAFGSEDIRVEDEVEFEDVFTDSEKGAMPPFGMLYGVPTYVDWRLTDMPEIYFNAGSHRETIKMTARDYLDIAGAEIGDYSAPRPHAAAENKGVQDETQC